MLNYTISKLIFDLNCVGASKENIRLAIQNYLHYLTHLKDVNSVRSIATLFEIEPERYKDIPDYVYAYIAALVEKFSIDEGLPVPTWVFKSDYYLTDKWFPDNVLKYQKVMKILEKKSPEPFKKRNLFVNEDVLVIA